MTLEYKAICGKGLSMKPFASQDEQIEWLYTVHVYGSFCFLAITKGKLHHVTCLLEVSRCVSYSEPIAEVSPGAGSEKPGGPVCL
jgi:hypothetical protein